MTRVVANGKHLDLGEERFVVRGVTYGSFTPRPDGYAFPDSRMIRADLTQMADIGLNTVRIYERPAPDLLDVAAELGMRIIVGLDFHDWRMEPEPSIRSRLVTFGLPELCLPFTFARRDPTERFPLAARPVFGLAMIRRYRGWR